MKSARIVQPKEPLQIEDLEAPQPRHEEVLIEVESCGICHSDLHLWEGGYAGSGGEIMNVEERGVKFPLTPGHEIAGTVKELGEAAGASFSRGDKVLVYPWIGEGLCPACRTGQENVCDSPKTLGIYRDGGYSENVLVPSYKYLVKIGDLDAKAGSILACSGLTAYTSVIKSKAKPGENMVMVGAGGLGLMAIQIAKAITNSNIIVLDLDDQKLDQASRLGADRVINAKTSKDVVEEVKNATRSRGAESVIDFVNNGKTVPDSFRMLRKRGRLVLVGLFGGSFELGLATVPLRAQTITGAYTGSLDDLVHLVALAKAGRIKSIVSDKVHIDEINEALQELKAGRIAGRAVMTP